MQDRLEILRTPIAVGSITLRHRMIMAPMGDRNWTLEGTPGPGLLDYFGARAKGGTALIMTGGGQVHPDYLNGQRPGFSRDSHVPGLRQLTDVVHAEGVPIFAQIDHGGASATPSVTPSGVACITYHREVVTESRALTTAEVVDMRDRFIMAAERAQAAGFDGVEMAGQATHLIGNFLSPKLNLRTDEYGGHTENRARFAIEIIRGIRERCGDAFVIGYALGADDLQSGGTVPADSIPYAQLLERAGIDFIDIRVGTHETFSRSARAKGHNRYQERNGNWDYTRLFKDAVSVPIFGATHGDYDPASWERALARDDTDVIQIAKPMITDPQLPNKVLAGRHDDARPCIFCMRCLDPEHMSLADQGRTYCAVNPEAGREGPNRVVASDNVKTVAVIGAGPGGLEAARTAALRGHKVTVIEKGETTGGALNTAATCLANDVYADLSSWLARQCRDAGVEFEFNVADEATRVEQIGADAVVLATGAQLSATLDAKGSDKRHVINAAQALHDQTASYGDIAIVGGNQIGVQLALTLASRNAAKSITIIEPERVSTLALDMGYLERIYVMTVMLPQFGIQAILGSRVGEIKDRELILIDQVDGSRERIKADTVISALPLRSDRTLADRMAALGIEIMAVGDQIAAGPIDNAIHQGAAAGRAI